MLKVIELVSTFIQTDDGRKFKEIKVSSHIIFELLISPLTIFFKFSPKICFQVCSMLLYEITFAQDSGTFLHCYKVQSCADCLEQS